MKPLAYLCAGISALLSMVCLTQCSQPTPEKVIIRPQIMAVNNNTLEIDSIERTDSSHRFSHSSVLPTQVLDKSGSGILPD